MKAEGIMFAQYDTKIGKLTINAERDRLVYVGLTPPPKDAAQGKNELTDEAAKQITEYLRGERKVFELPISLDGTDFQKKVWEALLFIPYGEVRSYKDIAEYIGQPKACRAVGEANNKNPLMIIVPCHRVIGADKKLVGYGGGLALKKLLLETEEKYR